MPALVNQDKAGEAEAEVPGQWVIYQAGSEGRMQKAGGAHWAWGRGEGDIAVSSEVNITGYLFLGQAETLSQKSLEGI